MTGWITNLVDSSPAVIVPAGALIALAVIALGWRALRKQKPDKTAVRVAILLASAFSAQGTYEVATTRAHLPVYLAGGLFVVFEMMMLASGIRAHQHYEETSTETEAGTLGPHSIFVWIIAGIAGFAVSLIATSAPEYIVRLSMPLLVAGIWRLGYVSPKAKRKIADAITFRWSLRRIGVRIGMLVPGEQDLATASADRQVRQMTAHAHALHHGSILRFWHAGRLRRLARNASDAVVADVQSAVSRVHYIEDSTAPSVRTGAGAVLPSRWWLAPWMHARRSALAFTAAQAAAAAQRSAYEALHADAAQRIAAVQDDAARQITDMRTAVEETLRQAAGERASAVAQAETFLLGQHALQLEVVRAQHAQEIAELATTRTAPAPRSTTVVRRTAGRTTLRSVRSGDDGERSASNAPSFSDDEAVALLLRTHSAPNYQWSPAEVTKLTDAAFRRARKLIGLVAEHHAQAAAQHDRESGADDASERQLADSVAV